MMCRAGSTGPPLGTDEDEEEDDADEEEAGGCIPARGFVEGGGGPIGGRAGLKG